MKRKRILPFLVAAGMLILASCSEEKSDSSVELQSVPKTSETTEKLSPPPLFRIYYEKEGIPEIFLEEWKKGKELTIEQTQLVIGKEGMLPSDADLFILSPRLIGALEKKDFASYEKIDDEKKNSPIFTNYQFDENNEFSRPWRWSPYFFCERLEKGKPQLGGEAFFVWTASQEVLWPDDWQLLCGMLLKQKGFSANAAASAQLKYQCESFQKIAEKKIAPSELCWEAMKSHEIRGTLILAAERFRNPEAEKTKIKWSVPRNGTLIHFDHFLVPSRASYWEMALELVDYVLAEEQQGRLMKESGYFSVQSKMGKEMSQASLPVPKGKWFHKSEFLMTYEGISPLRVYPEKEEGVILKPDEKEEPEEEKTEGKKEIKKSDFPIEKENEQTHQLKSKREEVEFFSEPKEIVL